jgi:hypothetical protein
MAFIGQMAGQWFVYLLIRTNGVFWPSSPPVLRRGIDADAKREGVVLTSLGYDG